MDCGEAIPSLDRISWPGDPGLNNAKPRLEGRQPGSYNPSEAKTPGEALSYIELLYKSGRMEDLARLLRRSQVFRAAWLILQQSSPAIFETAAGVNGSSHQRETQAPAHLPVPASGLPSLPRNPEPEPLGPEAGRTEPSPQVPVLRTDSGARNYSSNPRTFKVARSLTSLFQAYQNQDRFCAQESQLGQLVSIRA
jgi:hypothetical protein